MSQGLQVFDEKGDVVIDITDRLTQIIKIVKLEGTSGRIDVNIPNNKEMFVFTEKQTGYDIKVYNNSITYKYIWHDLAGYGANDNYLIIGVF